jgi:hypothetical protein
MQVQLIDRGVWFIAQKLINISFSLAGTTFEVSTYT